MRLAVVLTLVIWASAAAFAQSADLVPVPLQWKPVEGAGGYRVEIQDSDGNDAFHEDLTEPSVKPSLKPGAYRLRVSRAAVTPIELLIPQTGALRDVRPSFALVGLGLRSSGASPPFIQGRMTAAYGDRSFPIGEGPGVIVIGDPGRTPRETFYEPFSFSRYYRGGKTTVTLRPGVP